MPEPFFSLITGTLGRTQELELFLQSLVEQSFKEFDVIIVDQNPDEMIDDIIDKYSSQLNLIRIREKAGLSRARNAALKIADGLWCAFPDDDCIYPPDILAGVYRKIEQLKDCDAISVMVTDSDGHFSAGGFMAWVDQTVNKKNIWRCAVSPSIFVKCDVTLAINGFDEDLGVGAGSPWGAGEESDFLLRIISHGRNVEYVASLRVYHPRFTGPWNRGVWQRGFMYGCGMGYVLRKHGYTFLHAIWFAILQLLRVLQAVLLLNFGKACYHLYMSAGRLYGFWSSGRSI